VVLLEILSFAAKSSAEKRVKSSTERICKVFSWTILFGPIPFIFVSFVCGLLVSFGSSCSGSGCSLGFGSIGLGRVMSLYFLGRAEYPKAMKNKPNRSKTIMNAAVIRFTS